MLLLSHRGLICQSRLEMARGRARPEPEPGQTREIKVQCLVNIENRDLEFSVLKGGYPSGGKNGPNLS